MALSALGKASATQYRLVLDRIPVSGSKRSDMDALKLNIFNVNLPSVTLDTQQMNWQGMHTQMHQGGITFDQLNISFVVDSQFKNWKVCFDWLVYIANNYNKPTSKPSDYVTDASLIVLDNWDNALFNIRFINLWITSLGELTFSVRDGETHIECTANFNYDRYEVQQSNDGMGIIR
ncbi:MAG: hypothetical protein WC346_13485 [Methanogenium sp.]|jgi:hypothetical protein